jgi:hypothetical protein
LRRDPLPLLGRDGSARFTHATDPEQISAPPKQFAKVKKVSGSYSPNALGNCLKRGVGDAPSVDLGGVRKQKCRSGGP